MSREEIEKRPGEELRLASLSDTPIYDVYVANRASAVLAVAVRIGLFSRLERAPASAHELASELGLTPRGVDALLVSLISLGLLERQGSLYRLSPRSEVYLVPGKLCYLGGLIDLDFDHFMTPEKLLRAMRTGRQTVYGDKDVWAEHEVDSEQARRFTLAMHSISVRPALAVAELFDFGSYRCLLDVGGGSGIYSIAALARHPLLSAILFDIPPVCDIAREFLARHGLEARVRVHPGDMFRDPLPEGADVILFSQIYHDWPPEKGRELTRKAYDALPDGGVILIHEKLLNEDRTGPAANALISLDMLLWTDGQQYTSGQIFSMLLESGFQDPRMEPSIGYWTLVSARK